MRTHALWKLRTSTNCSAAEAPVAGLSLGQLAGVFGVLAIGAAVAAGALGLEAAASRLKGRLPGAASADFRRFVRP